MVGVEAVLLAVGYGAVGVLCLKLFLRYEKVYPHGHQREYLKWVPALGYGLLLYAADLSFFAHLPGILLIVASIFFLPKQKQDETHP